ncbi:hypothetical protein PUNSTDRAFT_77498 [Punctularia strigosozonata HHB-11173 SS5]|uniref:FAD binding domain-containing protein n=1 Tax=Punctularia strigosozonata (strain HHB-11173) TaxID=741275 RepID=R7S1W0_PUNST|nr:uncharacterized protein PUNSTDRAFT_77498 [Punctularia strigosozonata HHB-11173 SS5]EIN03849.1 hypothetical protein PUNSTDRAFT_77498 [Punctularia strigosozonata HHB-11173 SS5]
MPTSTIRESEVDVLIIGAGPAGLMCANGLASAGVNVRIIDQRPGKVAAGQADGIQPRTMESYGLLDKFLKQANQLHLAAFYNPGPNGGIERTSRSPDVSVPTARFPFEATLHQGHIERLFLDSMEGHGLRVDRPTVPTSIEVSGEESALKNPHAYPVKVVVTHLDASPGHETEVIHAKFVVGADGAHSWVRKSLGIAMEGEQSDYVWGVVDITPDTDFPDIRNKTAIHSENGSCMIIPREGDVVRLYIQLDNKDVIDPSTGRLKKDGFGPERLLEVAKKSFYPYRISTQSPVDWWTLYQIGQRVASKFSVADRVFIAGDACHTHSPKAGQGMNASMNDTHNLGWKIVQVLRGWADISLLKTYEFERRKYAQDLIAFDKKFSKLFSEKPQSEQRATGVSHAEFHTAFQTFSGFSSGIRVHYEPSAIVDNARQELARNLTIGERVLPQQFVRAADARPYELQDLLPADVRFKILVFTGHDLGPARTLAERLEPALSELTPRDKSVQDVFDILSIVQGKKEEVEYTQVPPMLRSHWSKVLLDDTDLTGKIGGNGYETYGITSSGAIVVVRPDGYVGFVSALDEVERLSLYFKGFMKAL